MVSSFGLLYILQSNFVIPTPAYGGTLTEGIIGSPRFINPVLAISDADRDLTALMYSGLLRATQNGGYEANLAESYNISEDGTTYTFTLRENATFHDGTPLTSADVAFTVSSAQNPALKSPVRANWDGVNVETPDARTVIFTLKSPYAPFIDNATLGILPERLWQDVSAEEFPFSELNTSPVGSGPFEVSSISRSQGGIPSSYVLTPFAGYTLGEAYLSRLTLRFYQSESALLTALERGEVQSANGISPVSLAQLDQENIVRAPLNRVFGVFFNQNQSEVLRMREVRQALNESIDRKDLVAQVLGGYGTPLTTPIPPALLGNSSEEVSTSSTDPVVEARAYLEGRGWTAGADGTLEKKTGTGKNVSTIKLSFTLATGNIPELRAAAEYLRAAWERVGAKVEVQIYEQGDLTQNVIRPRKYDALLFGEVVGRELDLFAFWHSSQRNDPGLNIALYANATADDALRELRSTEDGAKRSELIETILEELRSDIPAVFLYAPDFVYSVPNDIEGLGLGFIETPSDRFSSVASWHREVDYVWPIFSK
jgi:peptide/nickel transport system substrate-binding protein